MVSISRHKGHEPYFSGIYYLKRCPLCRRSVPAPQGRPAPSDPQSSDWTGGGAALPHPDPTSLPVLRRRTKVCSDKVWLSHGGVSDFLGQDSNKQGSLAPAFQENVTFLV